MVTTTQKKVVRPKPLCHRRLRHAVSNWQLYCMTLPAILYILLFCYKPMYEIIIAFKNFSMRKGIWGSPWAGLENFTRLFGSACANSSNSGESSTADVSNGFGQADSTQAELYYNPTGYPICDETITVSVTGPLGFTQDWNNTYQVKGIEEKFGIHLDGNPISTDAWSNQLTLLLATDDLPDLI